MQDDDLFNNQDSMFESLLHIIQMDLNFNDFIKQPDIVYVEPRSPKQPLIKSPPMAPRDWNINQEESAPLRIQKMIDFLALQQNEQLHRIQASRMDQQAKVKTYLSCQRIMIHEECDSREKHLKDNLNLSPRKRKRIDKQKIKLPKFKLG